MTVDTRLRRSSASVQVVVVGDIGVAEIIVVGYLGIEIVVVRDLGDMVVVAFGKGFISD